MFCIELNQNLRAVISAEAVLVLHRSRPETYQFDVKSLKKLRDWWNGKRLDYALISRPPLRFYPRKNGYVKVGCEEILSSKIRLAYKIWDTLQERPKVVNDN